ncbi:gliding motility protein RemB [Urechidicola croceus]|uniref:Gliding motility protein RemB n=1 Tax=Urechidicola croceus TaxID=1850246 RepID=A0A1D8P8J1_9FLAO|nr:gliding motility protein RemB [Urechidicola croceus]AOW20890.1 gliding motility protein RemB [Urechidicola croceus]
MKKYFLTLSFIIFTICSIAQMEKYPVYEGCESLDNETLKNCFKTKVSEVVTANLNLPETVVNDNFKGNVNIVFYVKRDGTFEVLYVNTPYQELKDEISRVFSELPTVVPAKYNNHDVEMQFVLPITIPLGSVLTEETNDVTLNESISENDFAVNKNDDLDLIKTDSLELLEHHSQLNLPYTHQNYSNIDYYYNRRQNSHTAVKPYVYSEIEDYVDLDAQKSSLMINKSTWFGKKLLNEHMLQVQGKDYWFTMDPIVDLQVGKADDINTYNNTRGVLIQGGLGKKLSFSSTIYESQGRFAEYVNQYAESIKPAGGNPAIIPGRGIAKEFKTDSYDYPVAEGYLSYTPNKFLNLQFGHGKNFIGDGYRSMFMSNNASPYPFFKVNTKFWKIKYTNLWMWLRDVRPEVTEDGVFKQKFMATHYLSWNVSKKLNIGLFESVIWENSNDRGFDINYLNPIIFYRAIEFSTGSRGGNAVIGLSAKYKFNNKFSMYSQLLIDEFTTSEIAKGNGYWGNKNGFQIGAKYFNAFKVKNLYLQAEYNVARPYTYSHNEPILNYGHNNQSMAHTWGANFNEFVGIASYTKGRWYGTAKIVAGKKGFDIEGDATSYGGDIYRDYSDRNNDYGVDLGQGNTTNIFIGDLQVGYLVNPATNLKLFTGITFRNFNPETITTTFDKTNTTWFNVGLRTDLFDWTFDF